MPLTVKQRAETIATFRYIEVHLMETLARWTPSTPEMEVKVLFGRHVWETAQHADALGKRTYELRAPMHFTQKPNDEYLDFLTRLAAVEGAANRIHALYDVTLPALARRYQAYLDATDTLLDAPSVKVIQRILADMATMRADADALRREQPKLAAPGAEARALAETESRIDAFVVHHVRPAMQGATT
jgi:hypothetical protein